MTWLDIIVVIVTGISTIYSLYRGLVKEFLSFMALVVGYLVANSYYLSLQKYIHKILDVNLPGWAVYLFVFIFFTILFLVLESALRKAINVSVTLKFADVVGGAFIGFFKAALILSLIMLPLQSYAPARKLIKKSVTPPYLLGTFKALKKVSNSDLFNSYENGLESVKKGFGSWFEGGKDFFVSGKEKIVSKYKKVDEDISESDRKKLGDLVKERMEE
jgi:membrane protein required for colicin V production